ncbi:hypothetical protein D9Q98_009756 [Chlorella vulgaris]|uniref:CBF1-interacting co-repressor CIR N-terminal domain-containing protein n=1 Tax=Chlorella vulgaris TaxID=3077 RepID=A0A9D4YSJ2_CHLVU|nr:hypothetical protein D9Q98_009756 [Chlorella vulgaris]
MGGHGGLNILPQKRWNVYGRENRLKVIQDEAKYEEEQAAVRERAEQADRERRRDLLKERARRRYKGEHEASTAPEAASGALAYPDKQQEQQPAPDAWQPDSSAIRGLAAGQADHRRALEQQSDGSTHQHQRKAEQAELAPPRKKQRRQEARAAAAAAAAAAGPPLSLAELAARMDEAPPPGDGQAGAAAGDRGGELARAEEAQLERFNLFAEEEAAAISKRKNPEVEAEKRDERRRRGNVDTQTSDARFDEQFMFANKLYGQAAMPWYAKKGSTLPAPEGAEGQQQEQGGSGGRRQMWQWEMQARAALAGAGQLHVEKPQAPATLLAGVKVMHNGSKRRHGSRASSDAGDSSSSRSDSSSSDSSSSGSDGGRRRHRSSSKHRHRRRRGEAVRDRSSKKGKQVKRRGKDTKRSRKGKEERENGAAAKKSVDQLRLERLQREDVERARQQRVVAVAAGRDPALAGKKYHQSFGFGRRG